VLHGFSPKQVFSVLKICDADVEAEKRSNSLRLFKARLNQPHSSSPLFRLQDKKPTGMILKESLQLSIMMRLRLPGSPVG